MAIFKKRKLWLLPVTTGVTFPCFAIGTPELGLRFTRSKFALSIAQYFHLYITSDEGMKAEEWGIFDGGLGRIGAMQYSGNHDAFSITPQKIIATTDNLMNQFQDGSGFYSIPGIDADFIESFIVQYNKKRIPSYVDVEYKYTTYETKPIHNRYGYEGICPTCKKYETYVTYGDGICTNCLIPKIDKEGNVIIQIQEPIFTKEEFLKGLSNYGLEIAYAIKNCEEIPLADEWFEKQNYEKNSH